MNTTDVEFGHKVWSQDERATIMRLLEHKLGAEHIAVRPGNASTKVAFVESWKAIELANSIFGFDGWSSQIVDICPDFIEEQNGRYKVGVTAVVKVILKDGTFHEDVGYGIKEDRDKGKAIENAKKEAVSDARKRALRVFGNALGNCIYDKEYIKKIKDKIKGSATQSVSYDQLRAMSSGASQIQTDTQDVRAQPNVQYPPNPQRFVPDIVPEGEDSSNYFDNESLTTPTPQQPQNTTSPVQANQTSLPPQVTQTSPPIQNPQTNNPARRWIPNPNLNTLAPNT